MHTEVSDFLHFCRIERRLAPLTCSAYERDVTACVRFPSENGIDDLRLVRPPDLRRFLTAEAERRPGLGSQARTVAALKYFFRFLVENEDLDRDPALVLRTPKKSEALPDVLDRRELGRLLAATERDDVWQRHFPGKRERDRLPLALFANAGLRRSELLGLDWSDVDSCRARDPDPTLFVGVQGRRLSPTIMVQTFLRYARAAGVTGRKRVTPHTLQHVFASELLRAGANLRSDSRAARPQASRVDAAVHA